VDFGDTDAQQELTALSRRILIEGATPRRLAELEACGVRFDRPLWAELARAGILAAGLPESLDGAGLGLLEQCSVLTEIGRTVAPVPYLASIVLGAGALARFGTPDQQRRWAVPAGRGELVLAAALSEDDSDDPRAPAATAEPGPDGWLLSGVKTAVLAAPAARLMLVPATTPDGVAVFLAGPLDGVRVEEQDVTGGVSAGRVTLDGVRLPAGRLLGGIGSQVTDWLVARGTVGLCALQLGVTERALELTAEYARTREQFGRPIGSFQAVAQRLADAYVDVEAIRLTMWQAAWQLAGAGDAAGPAPDAAAADVTAGPAIATAKFWAADAGHRVAHTAVHVHGGMGIATSYPLHRYFTAAKHNEFALGGATAQLRRLGAALALDC
jgi:3-oxocholest-4-en-26-oyl-CoA dehydrogenase beta subunit